jgi:hypothetical protein
MRALKRLISIVGGAIIGIVLLVFGVQEYFQVKALRTKGKTISADVTDAEEHRGRRGRRKYYLTVNFKTEAGQSITSEESVSSTVYDQGTSTKKVDVTYLPDKPEVCRIGPVSTNWVGLGLGVFMLGFSAVSAFSGKSE